MYKRQLCAWVLFTQVFLLTQAKGSSMFPAVKDGDLLICYRLQKTYAKNDVVVYTQGGKLRVGRILGREGDLVALDDSGTLVVNGAVQSGEILYPTYAKDALEYPYTVPEGCVFVMGDNRNASTDSRDARLGCVDERYIMGRVYFTLFPVKNIGVVK